VPRTEGKYEINRFSRDEKRNHGDDFAKEVKKAPGEKNLRSGIKTNRGGLVSDSFRQWIGERKRGGLSGGRKEHQSA